MRWESLFADLEAQLEREGDAEAQAAAREQQRLHAARVSLAERVRNAASAEPSRPLTVRLRDGTRLTATPLAVGRDWLSAGLATGEQLIVLAAAVVSVSFDAAQLEASRRPPIAGPGVVGRMRVQVALRDLARRRVPVELVCESGAGWASVCGTLDTVGVDHVDVAVHPLDRPRRATEIIELRTVALSALSRVVVR